MKDFYLLLFSSLFFLFFSSCKKEPDSGPTSVNGQVWDIGAGKPIPFAKVTLKHYAWGIASSAGAETKVADADGKFHFDFNAEKKYEYRITGEDPYCEKGVSGFIKKGVKNENVFILLSPLTLPSITQEGKNTFGFLLNGKVWLPKSETFSRAKQSVSYSMGRLNMHAIREIEQRNIDQSIGFYFDDSSIVDTGTYTLTYKTNGEYTCGRYTDHVNTCKYYTGDTIPGILRISRLDNHIISGTFQMTLVNSTCDTVRITQGRFDLIYP